MGKKLHVYTDVFSIFSIDTNANGPRPKLATMIYVLLYIIDLLTQLTKQIKL